MPGPQKQVIPIEPCYDRRERGIRGGYNIKHMVALANMWNTHYEILIFDLLESRASWTHLSFLHTDHIPKVAQALHGYAINCDTLEDLLEQEGFFNNKHLGQTIQLKPLSAIKGVMFLRDDLAQRARQRGLIYAPDTMQIRYWLGQGLSMFYSSLNAMRCIEAVYVKPSTLLKPTVNPDILQNTWIRSLYFG